MSIHFAAAWALASASALASGTESPKSVEPAPRPVEERFLSLESSLQDAAQADAPKTPPPEDMRVYWKDGLRFESNDKRYKFRIGGRIHYDSAWIAPDDDTEAGLPDLLGRSLRTTRRPDVFKIAVTLKALGREGLGALVDQVCAHAREFAHLVAAHPGFELYAPPTISTVLFRPAHWSDDAVADVRRTLLTQGHAVLGRARPDGRLWLKATLLNPHTTAGDLAALLKLVEGHTPR